VLFDIQYKTLPQYHNRRRRLWLDFYLKKLFASADYVYLLSEFERANILRCFGDRAARKCVVGYVAIEWSRFQGSSDEPPQRPLDNPYILSVCHHFPHKNVTTLAKAFDALSSQHRDLHLVLVGRQSPDNLAFVQRSLSPRSATRVHFTGFVSDAELGSWYRHARLFALPSIYEGFGMPAVEAMGLGIRTIVSDAGALPEVTLNKAEYVRNPLDVDEWISAIGSNLDTPRLAPTLSEEIRSRYSIESIARRYLSVLHN
jgi:glycosyltransferase involved in cell wall biosynthesis